MKKGENNTSSFLAVALIVITIAYTLNFFITDKTIRNLKGELLNNIELPMDTQTHYEFDNIPTPSRIKDTVIYYNKALVNIEYDLMIVYSGDKMSISMKKWYHIY